ncbi:MAG TPA: hypothetical protein VF606_00485, partial [Geminicoccaceae bacterium]
DVPVRGPGGGPVVAALGVVAVGRPVEVHPLDQVARPVGRPAVDRPGGGIPPTASAAKVTTTAAAAAAAAARRAARNVMGKLFLLGPRRPMVFVV